MRKPFWTKEELAARAEREEKDRIWFRRACGCGGDGCLIFFFTCLIPFAWLLG